MFDSAIDLWVYHLGGAIKTLCDRMITPMYPFKSAYYLKGEAVVYTDQWRNEYVRPNDVSPGDIYG